MSQSLNSNTPCCSIPTVHHHYEPKGRYSSYGGFEKAYITGPSGSTTALVVVYDIFGFFPQTVQGADILAQTLDARVIMPDFWKDQAFPSERHPPRNDGDSKLLEEFFKGVASVDKVLPELLSVGQQLKQDGANKVGALGYCFGGKLTLLAGAKDVFDAVASIHPAVIAAEDGEALKVPLGLFISRDEPIDEYEKMLAAMAEKPFASKNAFKLYKSMRHGFAAARANLRDDDGLAAFEDVYGRISTFFKTAFEDWS